MRALRKYSSLWIRTRKVSAATATHSDTDIATMKIAVFEIRFPSTGSKPATKVIAMSVFANGSLTPKIGSTTKRNSAVNKVLSSEILSCANTMSRNALPSRWQRVAKAIANGP